MIKNHMEKTMEHEMETREYIGIAGVILRLYRGNIGGIYRIYRAYIVLALHVLPRSIELKAWADSSSEV